MDANQLLSSSRSWATGSLLALTLILTPVAAQEPVQLEPGIPVTGQIQPGTTQTWSFMARDGAMISLKVEATSDNLDPVINLQNSSGVILTTNDDVDYPANRNALLEAITMPRTDTYIVEVSNFGQTSGEYTLLLLPGFSRIGYLEDFNNPTDWETQDTSLVLVAGEDSLTLGLEGIQTLGIATNTELTLPRDYFAQIRGIAIGREGWVAGLVLRLQADGSHYLLTISSKGLWRFLIRTPDGEQLLRDWTPHPAIIPEQEDFTLGVLANNTAFDIFYNEQFIGQVIDATLSAGNRLGIAAGTANVVGGQAEVQFDELIVTLPDEDNNSMVVPEQLTPGSGPTVVQQLERQRLIPTGGAMILFVPESFARDIRPGISRIMLARGSTFGDFALGTTLSWQTHSDAAAGCGLVFRSVDDTHYALAYLDQTGSYGVSQRAGDTFLPGLFGTFKVQDSDSYQLLVVAKEESMVYYIDGRFVGALQIPVTTGEVGNAVVNFDPVDTACQFTDTWLWQW